MDLQKINEFGFEKISIWMTLVLGLSFSMWWNIFILTQCYAVFLLATANLAFNLSIPKIMYVIYVIDFFYLCEVIFTMTYLRNPRMRKLRYAKSRGWFFILVDLISIIPLELMFTFYYIEDEKNSYVRNLLLQNRALRMYRIFRQESYYMVTIRTSWKYVVFIFLHFLAGTVIIGHVFTCIWFNVEKSISCDPDKFNCYLWYETNMIYLVMHNWSGDSKMFRKPAERIVVTGAILLGFIFIFIYIYPYTLYISLQLFYRDALYYEKYERLQAFLRNMISRADLKVRIMNYFGDLWSRGQDESHLKFLLKNVPLGLRKDIFTDIYWEALRHSELFREVSRSCKRSLALVMTTEYHPSGEVVYYKGQNKIKMMFLVEGIVQIMAEENEESPLLSFSNGTVFGELSLFLHTQSQAIVKCKNYCEFQTLSMREIINVLKDYPKDKKLISRILNERLLMARFTQWRKKKFKEDQKFEILFADSSFSAVKDCVKWLKTQWRTVWEINKRHQDMIKAQEEGTRLTSWQRPLKTESKIEFISNYLDLIVLSDLFEEKDVVCLQTTFPWSIDPSTQFLRVWSYIILITSFIPALAYPFCTAWLWKFPWPVYLISYAVTLIFAVDVFLKLHTATKTKHTTITKFSAVLRRNLQQPTFYLDVIAALPYQLYLISTVNVSTARSYEVGLPLHPAIFKSHVFIALKVPPGKHVDKITILKNIIIYFLIVYWLSEVIQLYSILNLFNVKNEWVERYTNNSNESEFVKKYFLSVMKVLVITVSVPDDHMYPDENWDLVFNCIIRYFSFMFFCYFFGECYGALTIKVYGWESFRILMQRITEFLRSKRISENISSRILKIIKFQWDYDRGDYISSDISILKSIPPNLRRKVHFDSIFKSLRLCPLFEEETDDFLLEVVEKSDFLSVPSGSVLVTYGHTSHAISIINRGHCQLNSFLLKDVAANLGRSIILGPGAVFPFLSSFCNCPSPISVVTVTDCEVLMINLNDLINAMMKHKIFKDIVEVVKEVNLVAKLKVTKPALMKLDISTSPAKLNPKSNREIYERFGFFGKVIRPCFLRGTFFSNKTFLKYWEFNYVVLMIITYFSWPCCFGVLITYSHIILPILIAGKSIILCRIIIRCYTPYYNKNGLAVTHPLYTCLNYLSSAFVLDIVRIFPLFALHYYAFNDPYDKPNTYVTLATIVQFSLHVIDIFGYIDYLGTLFNERYYIIIFKICVMLFLNLNMYVNLTLLFYTKWTFAGPRIISSFELQESNKPNNPELIKDHSIWSYYVLLSYWIISCWNSLDFAVQSVVGSQLCQSYALSFMGTVINFYVYASLCSNSIASNVWGAVYQEKITSVAKFLKHEKADERLIERLHTHYNYEWSKTRGENLKEIFRHLPLYLCEELWYPLYIPTFNKNYLFEEADQGFLKILAIHVKSVFFPRGSVIIFKNEAQSYIYFVHRGKCFVYDWFLVLDMGSMVGDIQQTGLMQNKVYALTHVEMLKISSCDFFMIMNNFDELEANFMYRTKTAENFIKSDVYRVGHKLRLVDSKDVVNAFDLRKKDIGFEDESQFEDPENSSFQTLKIMKYRQKEKFHFFVIYPTSWKMMAYTYFYLANIMLTLVCLSTFTLFGGLTMLAFIVIGILDFLWLVVILVTFRVGLIDHQSGDVITQSKYIAKNYLKKIDGFFIDILGLIPFEFIALLVSKGPSRADIHVVSYLRMIRVVRIYRFYKYVQTMFRNLKVVAYRKCFLETCILFLNLILLSNAFMYITEEPSIVAARDPYHFKKEQFYAFVLAFEYMTNFLASSNLCVIIPTTREELLFFNVTAGIFIYLKGKLISQILYVTYVKNLATSYYKSQVSDLESYFSKKDASPILIKELVDYKTKLLQYSRSENMPSLLKKAPMGIQIPIMRDLYIHHVTSCPLFEGLDAIFLFQLILRVKREVYFPGQKIAEQGDVDHQMYFIHKGEVYVINQTKEKAYIEYIVGILNAGDFFGASQGICLSRPHAHTYRGRTLVELLVLHIDSWADLRRSFPDITQKIYQKAKMLRYI